MSGYGEKDDKHFSYAVESILLRLLYSLVLAERRSRLRCYVS